MEHLKVQLLAQIALVKDEPAARAVITDCLEKLKVMHHNAAPVGGLDADAVIDGFKAALKARGSHGIVAIGKKFKSMDDNGNGMLCYDEFKKACKEMKLKLSEADTSRIFRVFDADASGFITYDELLVGIRGVLNDRRKDMVGRAFKVLDKTGDGVVTMHDVQGRFNARTHPDVIAGTKKPEEVLAEFLSVFEGGKTKNASITLEELEKYYSYVSASVDDDDYFELMVRNAWHISGGEGWSANTTCKRVLATLADGSQAVLEVKDDLGVDVKDPAAVKKKLMEQGHTDVVSVSLYGDMSGSTPPTPSPRGSGSGYAAPPTPPSGRKTTVNRNASSGLW